MRTNQLFEMTWTARTTGSDRAVIESTDGRTVASVNVRSEPHADGMNIHSLARLFAASPQLLAVCQRLAEFEANTDWGPKDLEGIIWHARRACRQASRTAGRVVVES